MKVVFRVDASFKIGTGHVTRCLTLADGLRARQLDPYFVCREHPGNMIEAIRKRGYIVMRLPAGPGPLQADPVADGSQPTHFDWLGCHWHTDAEQTLSAVQALKPDMLVIDHYAIDIRWEEVLRPHVRRLMVIDDLANRRHLCDFLLDQNWFGGVLSHRYQGLVPENCVSMLGPSYALLKPEYATLRELMLPFDGEVRRVLVFMGGSDPSNETGKVIEALTSPDLTYLQVDVVIGANHPDPSAIAEMAEARQRTRVYTGLASLAGLMIRADLMIGGGGATTWERMSLGLPALVVCIADNQVEMSRALSEAGYLKLIGSKDDVNASLISDAVRAVLDKQAMLSAISSRSRDLVRGDGTDRVCDAILPTSYDNGSHPSISQPRRMPGKLQVRRACLDDAGMLFEWRNDLRTRRYFRNAAPLSRSGHMKWFSQTLANERSELLVVLFGGHAVGCVRFDIDSEQAQVSIYLDPSRHGRGLGGAVLHQAMEWMHLAHPLVTLFCAEVLIENSASAKLFQRYGYSLARQKFEFRKPAK